MTSPTRAFQGADEGRLDLDAVARALGERYTIVRAPARSVRRRRLDTADRRLRRAGLSLEYETAPRWRRLVLGRADGSQVAELVEELHLPALVDVLPAGPVGAEVAAVAGIRALIAVVDERRAWQRWDLNNTEGKTVVRIDTDEPRADDGRPAELAIRGLRGYDDHTRRVARLLLGLGLRPVEPTAPGPTAVAHRVRVDPDAPAIDLVTRALIEFQTAMRANLPGLLDDVDTEFLHEFRVALRRTRTTLRLARPILPEVLRREWEPAFAWVGALTTPVRDLDVYVLGLPTMAGWLVAADPADLEPFARHLALHRSAARATMLRGLRSARYRRQVTAWETTLAALATTSVGAVPEPVSAGDLAGRHLDRAHRRVVRGGMAISGESPADDLHRLRGRCKELRYALEVFAPVADQQIGRRAIADLKGLQDVLGRFQDAEVQRRALREFADEMMLERVPAAALLALGELIARLDAEQVRARDEFDRAFAAFVRASGTTPTRLQRIEGRT